MQTYFSVGDVPREQSYSETPFPCAKKTREIFVAGQDPKEWRIYNSIPKNIRKGSSTFSPLPSSVSGKEAMTVREAGRRGGLSCLCNRGRDFFVEIGKKGQLEMRRKHPDMARKWGKMGGRPKKPALQEIMGEAKK